MMDIQTAVTILMRWAAQNPHGAQHSSDVPTAMNASRKSGSAMERKTVKMVQMRR